MTWKNIHDSLESKVAGEIATLSGRVTGVREHKNLLFVDVTDNSDSIQLVINKKENPLPERGYSLLRKGAYVITNGFMDSDPRGNRELKVSDLEVVGNSSLNVESPWSLDATDPAHSGVILSNPEIYVANPQRAAVLDIKSSFVRGLHDYFQSDGFKLVEPPIITDKTLYGSGNAIEAEVHGENVFLSQCATFELEPLALAFGKVYTISPAFRNEPSGSKRHLAEYTHAKAEVLLADIESLKKLSSSSIHYAMAKVLAEKQKQLDLLGVFPEIDGLLFENQEHVSYPDAIKITQKAGSETQYGEGLKRRDEVILTKHCGSKYVWVDFPPFETEGFPYRRLASDRSRSMTCDLIAPHGAGEMVGVAEKITDAEELIVNLIEKGQRENLDKFWNYIAIREYGMPPHGGIGAAPERIMYGLLELDHIRLTKPWPRYPGRKIVASRPTLPTYGSRRLQELKEQFGLN